jgi:hypothetical protein
LMFLWMLWDLVVYHPCCHFLCYWGLPSLWLTHALMAVGGPCPLFMESDGSWYLKDMFPGLFW